jgi:hypothetical protein
MAALTCPQGLCHRSARPESNFGSSPGSARRSNLRNKGCSDASDRLSMDLCPVCRILIDEATKAIRRHLEAKNRLSWASVHGGSDSGLEDLEHAAQQCSLAELQAVRRYEKHEASHPKRRRSVRQKGTPSRPLALPPESTDPETQ